MKFNDLDKENVKNPYSNTRNYKETETKKMTVQ